jgi:hypothetical protein
VYRVRFAAHSRSRRTIVPGFFLPRGAAPPKSGLNVTHPPTRSMHCPMHGGDLDKYDSSSIAGGCPGHAQTFAFVGCLVSRLMFFTLCHVRLSRFFISPPSSKTLGSRPRALKMNPRPFLSQRPVTVGRGRASRTAGVSLSLPADAASGATSPVRPSHCRALQMISSSPQAAPESSPASCAGGTAACVRRLVSW